jgi:hypothetical protein
MRTTSEAEDNDTKLRDDGNSEHINSITNTHTEREREKKEGHINGFFLIRRRFLSDPCAASFGIRR